MRLIELQNREQITQEIIKTFIDAGWKNITSKIKIKSGNGNKYFHKPGTNIFAKANFFNCTVVFFQKENNIAVNHKSYRLRDLSKIKLAVLCNNNNQMP